MAQGISTQHLLAQIASMRIRYNKDLDRLERNILKMAATHDPHVDQKKADQETITEYIKERFISRGNKKQALEYYQQCPSIWAKQINEHLYQSIKAPAIKQAIKRYYENE